MLKSIKFRLYPNEEQSKLLEQQFGHCRYIYNWALDYSQWEYKNNQTNTFRKNWQSLLPDLKQYLPWLKDGNSQSIQYELKNLESAYSRFYKKLGGFPKFKSKYDKQSFHVPQYFKLESNLLSIPKIKNIPIIISKDISSFNLRSITISKTKTDKYFASILYEDGSFAPIKQEITKELSLGIDLGIKEFAVCSNGIRINNPKFLENNMKRLRRLQQSFSRKIKNSSNRSKAKLKLALLHEKIGNQRNDFLHKTSTLICKNQEVNVVCVENLNIKGMVKNHKLAKSISSASWSEFVRQLTYKLEWIGKHLLKCGRFDPSSKTCNECGLVKETLKLSERHWICPCGASIDRDFNASKNIRDFALKLYPKDIGKFKSVERRDRMEFPSESISMKQKALA